MGSFWVSYYKIVAYCFFIGVSERERGLGYTYKSSCCLLLNLWLMCGSEIGNVTSLVLGLLGVGLVE